MAESGNEREALPRTEINFYVLALITVGILIYILGNAIEPEVDTELDFYEATSSAVFAAATIFAWIVAIRYWGSTVFGKAYLALAIAYSCFSIGWNLFWVYEIYYQIENPYPYYPDVFFLAFYPLLIYHIRTNFRYFKRSLSRNQKLIIIIIPLATSSIYLFFGIVPVEQQGGLGAMKIGAIPDYDETFYKEYLTGLAFIFASSLTFSSAMVATQVFQKTALGAPWGLLLVGIILNTSGDIYYYLFELFGDYERANPVTGIWVASGLVVCYALYKHRKAL